MATKKPTPPGARAKIGVREAERLTGVPHQTLNRWRRKGLLTGQLTLEKIRRVKAAQEGGQTKNMPALAEAGRILGVSRARVQQWQAKGLLPTPLTPDAVEALRQARAQSAEPQPAPPAPDGEGGAA